MSDDQNPELYSTTRPYECVRCGCLMRTHGIDGRCIACIEHPPVRCERCARVRFDPEDAWQDHPGLIRGEVMGMCQTCGAAMDRERAVERARESRKLMRDRERGYGPGTGDPFAGF